MDISQPSTHDSVYYSDNLSDINNVGLPLQDDIIEPLRLVIF